MIRFVEKVAPNHERVKQLLSLSQATGHYTNEGPVKALLEEQLSKLLQLDNKVVYCCNSGTSALHIAMYLAEQSQGRRMKWCIPSFTFPSCINGGLFDVDVLDINVSTATITVEQSHKYDGIILTNLFGTVVDIGKWEAYSRAHGKVLVYDNAASPLTRYKSKNICNYGDYAIGSLHHTKYLGFGEGGFLTLSKKNMLLRNKYLHLDSGCIGKTIGEQILGRLILSLQTLQQLISSSISRGFQSKSIWNCKKAFSAR